MQFQYAGFWPRLAANLLDFILLLPLGLVAVWGQSRYRLFDLYWSIPRFTIGVLFDVYLVQRYGGTPGKLLIGLQIRKTDGTKVGWREALIRFLPDLILGTLAWMGILYATLHLTDAEYFAITYKKYAHLKKLAPQWSILAQWALHAWMWSELIVMMTNKKRRALHDFIANTIVIHDVERQRRRKVLARK